MNNEQMHTRVLLLHTSYLLMLVGFVRVSFLIFNRRRYGVIYGEEYGLLAAVLLLVVGLINFIVYMRIKD